MDFSEVSSDPPPDLDNPQPGTSGGSSFSLPTITDTLQNIFNPVIGTRSKRRIDKLPDKTGKELDADLKAAEKAKKTSEKIKKTKKK